MALGLSFRGSCPSAPQGSTVGAVSEAVAALQSRFGYEVYQESPTQVVLEFGPTALLSLRVDADVIVGDAATTPGGPGFHKAVVDLLDELIETAGLSLEVEDETGYWRHRDFDRLRQEQMTWLRALIRQVSSWEQTTLRITWPVDGWAPAGATGIVTPMGRFTHGFLRGELERDGLAEFAHRFFLWPNPERDAYYHRARALYQLWNECRWVAPRTEAEELLLSTIAGSLGTARRLDPALPLPLEAWSEVVTLLGGDPAGVVKGPDMAIGEPVGYRRGDVLEPFPGGWQVRLPGSFLPEPEEDGGAVYWDAGRNFRLTGYRYSPPGPGQEDPTDRLLTNPTFDEVIGGYRFQAETSYEPDEHCWVLQGLVRGPGGMAVITLTWSDPRWEDWAVETFRTIQPPPLAPD
ncbi:MAG: hypothetical protein ACOY94_20820 [Bacillota bacterium]